MSDMDVGVREYEALIQGFVDDHFGVSDLFLPPEMVVKLRTRLLELYHKGEMHAAGIGRQTAYQQNRVIRGDLIRWIEPDSSDEDEQNFIQRVQDFISYLNKTCYTALNAFEFHFAFYEQGSFYVRHKDQFNTDSGRKYSLVCYLNDDWQSNDQGQLVLYLTDRTKAILPVGGRAVFFKSDATEHEVMPSATRYRLSITGWLKAI